MRARAGHLNFRIRANHWNNGIFIFIHMRLFLTWSAISHPRLQPLMEGPNALVLISMQSHSIIVGQSIRGQHLSAGLSSYLRFGRFSRMQRKMRSTGSGGRGVRGRGSAMTRTSRGSRNQAKHYAVAISFLTESTPRVRSNSRQRKAYTHFWRSQTESGTQLKWNDTY